jgi:tetratricopeptide (TPR) repeat protein
VNFEEAERAVISGRYGEVLQEAVLRIASAEQENRQSDLVRWLLMATQATRLIGRTGEALSHSLRALETARTLNDSEILAQAHLGQAAAFKSARDYDEALAHLRKAIEILPAGASDLFRAELLLETAETSLEAGLRAEAESALAKGGALVHWLREPRLLSWSLYLRSQWEDASPADLQLSAAYEIAKTVDFPELKWQILWKLGERAAQQGRSKMQEDCLWNAFQILTHLAEPLDPSDATAFWRLGPRRMFLDFAKRKFGGAFFQRVMQDGVRKPDNSTRIIRDLGFDSSQIPDFGRRDSPPEQ